MILIRLDAEQIRASLTLEFIDGASHASSKDYPAKQSQRQFLQDLQLNSAPSAMRAEDHSGEGSAVYFLKLCSSKSSNRPSTVSEFAATTSSGCRYNSKNFV